jgi:FAD/FMN-containing dehydrogenase
MNDTVAPTFGEATVQELRDAVRGEVLTPGDEGYAEASPIWNGMHDGSRPALIVRCEGAADVGAAIGFARSNALPIAVRAGGHSIAGFSTADGGVVVDLSRLRGVRVDPKGRRAYVEPGATWADVDHETLAHGLATTGGLVSSTGVAGFTLGGGIGWLMREHGLACDNLVGADLVAADGRFVRAGADENPELLWGLRGGGGNFGVVTHLELALHPIPQVVYAGPIFFPADAAGPLLRRFRAWAEQAPNDVTALVNLTAAPPLPPIPAEWHGKPVVALVAVSTADHGVAADVIAPLREVADPIADLCGPMPYAVMQSLLDPLWPKGIRSYFKATNLRSLDDELIDELLHRHAEAPSPQCELHVHQMGGAVAKGAAGSAFGDRTMPFLLNAVTGWQDPAADAAHAAWARASIAAAAPWSTGRGYVNFLTDPTEARSAYEPATLERLVALKDAYDPTNAFRLNQNVEPSA